MHLLRFSRICEFWSSKANWRLRFSLPSIILTDLLGNKALLSPVQKVMVCDLWLADLDPFCVFLCFKVRDRNCDWRQRKTQLWRRLLNFTVRMFVKSAVTFFLFFYLLFEILHWCACCAVSLCVNCAIQKCQTKYWLSSRQDKTFIIVTLQVQLFGTQLATKR